jgi:hypothetical protein
MVNSNPGIKTHVIFSAVGKPGSFSVLNSLKSFGETDNSLVITSSEHFSDWESERVSIQKANFNSTHRTKVLVRKLLLRSGILRILISKIQRNLKLENQSRFMPPHNARHFEYLRALRSLPLDDWAILVDSRDLVFQVQPTEITRKLDNQKTIHVFDEGEFFFKTGEIQKNRISPANWNWALQLRNFKVQELACLENQNILNSGCIIGQVSDLIPFIEESCRVLADSYWSNTALLDQASLNYISYIPDFRDKIEFHANGTTVLNMCGVVKSKFELSKGAVYVDGKLVPIVHQFDRFGTWSPQNGFKFSKREYRVQDFENSSLNHQAL